MEAEVLYQKVRNSFLTNSPVKNMQLSQGDAVLFDTYTLSNDFYKVEKVVDDFSIMYGDEDYYRVFVRTTFLRLFKFWKKIKYEFVSDESMECIFNEFWKEHNS